MEQLVLHFMEDEDDEIIGLLINTYLLNILQGQKKWGGSIEGRMTIDRNRLQGDFQLFNDYFSPNPVYPDFMFRRRFRMRVELFRRILQDIQSHDIYFVQKRDAAGRLGLPPL